MTKVIYNPALANIDEHNATSATFDIEPLHAGYGNTLGNSCDAFFYPVSRAQL
jgi:DNA-directed RNA polymerase alpha subunit